MTHRLFGNVYVPHLDTHLYGRINVYWKRLCMFLALVWRESPAGGRMTVPLSWEIARDLWSEREMIQGETK